MKIIDFFKDLFADDPEPPFLPSPCPEIDAVYQAGQIPMTARITLGEDHGKAMLLPIPDSSTREQAYTALKAHYTNLYGSDVTITVTHLCTTLEDDELGTVRHSASVTARCEHGLVQRIATINVVTQDVRSC